MTYPKDRPVAAIVRDLDRFVEDMDRCSMRQIDQYESLKGLVTELKAAIRRQGTIVE